MSDSTLELDALSASIPLIGKFVSQWLVPVVVESVVFGVYTLLVLCTAILILRARSRLRSRKALLLAICVGMYAVAAAHFGIMLSCLYLDNDRASDIQRIVLACILESGTSEGRNAPVPCPNIPPNLQQSAMTSFQRGLSMLISVNVFLSDLVVLWRAWVLWPRNRVVQSVSVALTLVTIALLIFNAVSYYHERLDVYASALAILSSWMTNIWATLLIGTRTYQHRRHVKSYLQAGLRTRAERALLLFVESGILYCLFWLPFIVSSIILCVKVSDPNQLTPSTVAWRAPHYTSEANLLCVLQVLTYSCLVDLVGMYPTTVILLVELSNYYVQRTLSVNDMPTLLPQSNARQSLEVSSIPHIVISLETTGVGASAEDILRSCSSKSETRMNNVLDQAEKDEPVEAYDAAELTTRCTV
ncbi:hypothetical protein PsYK624_044030 [Phanerochaete sordida]|uniref:Uncharacterized protein n=1 Tax=Phanerochaete sordida TaxID=48140 RepID=A0A9P3G698_9APHY|nr:hypothetical protein PsYK624_044030 [Phanerochaete sordida]